MYVAEKSLAECQTVALISCVHQFCLEQREIHVGWAFGCAPFARETIAQCGIQFRRTQRIVSIDPQFQRSADYVGAATRRHDFFMGGHERWAHDAGPFKTTAAAVALFEVADKRTIFECVREHGFEGKLERSREVFAQMIVDSVPAIGENFSWIENVFRIERSLDLAHYAEQLISELIAHVFRARDANTVLGRK